LRAADTGGPGRGCDRAAVVIGRHNDGRDVAVACATVGGPVGEGGACWAGEEEAPVDADG
jgi:hypothetical protein